MHSQSTVLQALEMREKGFAARRIAALLDVPPGTVRDWLAGRLPKHSRSLAHSSRPADICAACGCTQHRFAQLPREYVYLLGLYLGDGCISAVHRGVFRLRIALDIRYPGIIRAAASTLAQIRGGSAHVQSQAGNWVEVSAYSKSWPCLFPQHGPGKKHERRIVLADWQLKLVERWPDQLLRGLIESDGCRFQNTGRGNWSAPRYSFKQTSDDIRAIFCHACDLMGLHWTAAGGSSIYVSRKADVARLDEFIGPKR